MIEVVSVNRQVCFCVSRTGGVGPTDHLWPCYPIPSSWKLEESHGRCGIALGTMRDESAYGGEGRALSGDAFRRTSFKNQGDRLAQKRSLQEAG